MNIDTLKTGQLTIISTIDKINQNINSFGIYVEMPVAKDIHCMVSELLELLKVHMDSISSFLGSENMLPDSFDQKMNVSIKSIIQGNESLFKRITSFDMRWSAFAISKSPRDFCFDFEYLSYKLKSRFKMEESLIYMLDIKNAIRKN
jgi:hypothetical protein